MQTAVPESARVFAQLGGLPEAEEVLDLLLGGRRTDVLNVNGVGRHVDGELV